MKEHVLITGASGFLGYHLINAALSEGYKVFAAIRKNSNVAHLDELGIQYVILDYANPQQLAGIIAEHGIRYIIHAAGTTKANTYEAYDLVNNQFTFNLAQAAVAAGGVKKFVFISSLAAVGPLTTAAGLIEDDKVPAPVTAYGRSKLNAELNLKKVAIPTVVLRPTAIYGPREKDIFVIAQYLSKGLDPYIGRNAQQLSFVYGPDMARLAVSVLPKEGVEGAYNVSDGRVYSRYDFADIVKQRLQVKAYRVHLPVPVIKAILFCSEKLSVAMGKVPMVSVEKLAELMAVNWGCNISKATAKLGYLPEYDLHKGLDASLDWYIKHQWLKSRK